MTIQKRSPRYTDSLEHEDTDTLLDKEPIKKILNWHEIPAWMQDNAYITGGYRPPSNSYKRCIQSLFYLHNESVNIWSHLLGFILFTGLGIYFVWSKPYVDTLTVFDVTYFFIFIAGALTCLGFSASYHCFSCHSEKVSLNWNRCDYAGITSLIVGSFFPVIYYGFHCHQLFQIIYLSIIVVLGLVTATVTLAQHFRTPAYRWIRATLFISLGLFGVVPTLHGIYIYGFNNATKTISLAHLILMAVTYIFGALLYGARFPERMRPGAFNYFGASHQIFHLCVVVALLSHYLGVMSAMAFWHNPTNVEFCTGYM
ncbi:hemolysin-III related-domain-containing protein [Sporodiniella umbellata]|nr:hemolysin-III related-domain-containing protein [Sporodiniella umbellata]